MPAGRPVPVARRGLATAIDDAAVAVLLAAVLGVNVLRARRRRLVPRPHPHLRRWVPWGVTLPAAVLLAVGERSGGSPGKRVLGLTVCPAATGAGGPGLPAAMARSLLKTALPWELGHQAVWDLRAGRTGRGSLLAGAAYGLVGAQAVGAARPGGRTYADRLAGTVVLPAARGPSSVRPRRR